MNWLLLGFGIGMVRAGLAGLVVIWFHRTRDVVGGYDIDVVDMEGKPAVIVPEDRKFEVGFFDDGSFLIWNNEGREEFVPFRFDDEDEAGHRERIAGAISAVTGLTVRTQ